MRVFMLALLLGCQGIIGGPGVDPGDPPVGVDPPVRPADPDTPPPAFEPADVGLRRLSVPQYANSVRDLLGERIEVSALLPPDPVPDDEFVFSDVLAAGVTTSALEVESYDAAARQAAEDALVSDEDYASLLGCTPASAADPCVRTFLERFMRRAFRRPVEADEVDAYVGIVEIGETTADSVRLGVRHAIAAVLQSPHFIYRTEIGHEGPGGRFFDDYELASRLSFFLWDTLPDEALLDAAGRGELSTDEGLSAQTRRLLDDPRSDAPLMRFFREWLGLEGLDNLPKDTDVYPDFTSTLGPAMREEIERVLADVIEDRRDVMSLLTLDETYVNGELARLYGIEAAGGAEAVVVDEFAGGDYDSGGCDPYPGWANLCSEGEMAFDVRFPSDGEYVVSASAYGTDAGDEPAHAELTLDGVLLAGFDVRGDATRPQTLSTTTTVSSGTHRVGIRFTNDFYEPPANRDVRVSWLRVEGYEEGAGWTPVSLPPERRGLLSLGGMLSLYAQPIDTSPTQRGLFIRTRILCDHIPAPPPGVETTLPPPGGAIRTNRQRVERHLSDETCAGCHRKMDPLGLPLEHFDGIGAYRETHDGAPIDASGDLDGVAFDGAIELGERLAEDRRTVQCVARQMYRHALGQEEEWAQEAAIRSTEAGFTESDFTVRALIEALVLSDAFRTPGELQ